MTPGGWIVMSVSVSSVTVLMAWCVYEVLKLPKETERLRGVALRTSTQDKG